MTLNKIRQKHTDSASPKSQASGLVSGGIYNIRNMDSRKWTLTAGDVDDFFVAYVDSCDSVLADYFTITDDYYWYCPNGDVIDIPHLAATYNTYSHNII